MSDEPQVTASLGKVHVPNWDREDGEGTEEYTPAAAKVFAAELLRAAAVADKQAAAIEAACADGHEWNDGSNLGDGKHAFTSWRCRREGCEAYRTEPGHHVDDSAQIQALIDALPPDDELGRILLDFEGHPVVTLMGTPMSREDRIDGAALRAHIQPLLRKAMHALDESVLGKALGGPATESPFNIRFTVDPAVPADTLLIIGSCRCKHPIGDHDPAGCTVQLGPATKCQCDTPITKLTAVIRTQPQ